MAAFLTALLLAAAGPDPACTAQGVKLLVPATTAEAVCAKVKAAVARLPAKRQRVRVAVRFSRPGIASARLWRGGAALPEVSVAVSDRAMGHDTVALLADAVAAQLKSN